MRWCVCSHPADQTPNRRTAGVAALLALIGGTSTDAVMILLRAFPVARPELMDVPLLLSGGAPHRRGGSMSAMIERYQPFGRSASQLLFALRAVAPARVRASNGVSCCMSPVTSLVRASACLLPRQPTVRRHPLEVFHVSGRFQPLQHAPESGAQGRHLSRRSPCSNSSAALESSQVTGEPIAVRHLHDRLQCREQRRELRARVLEHKRPAGTLHASPSSPLRRDGDACQCDIMRSALADTRRDVAKGRDTGAMAPPWTNQFTLNEIGLCRTITFCVYGHCIMHGRNRAWNAISHSWKCPVTSFWAKSWQHDWMHVIISHRTNNMRLVLIPAVTRANKLSGVAVN